MNEVEAREWFEAARWPDGATCPRCDETDEVRRLQGRAHRPGLYECRPCRRQFTVTVGTPLHKTKLSLSNWGAILAGTAHGKSARSIQQELGIGSYGTVHRAVGILREMDRADHPWVRRLLGSYRRLPVASGRGVARDRNTDRRATAPRRPRATAPRRPLATERRQRAIVQRRPAVRGDCIDGPRPCPWVGCRYHLYFAQSLGGACGKVSGEGMIALLRPPWEMVETCALDLAGRGGMTLEEVGDVLGFTRERTRQLQARGLKRLASSSCGGRRDKLKQLLSESIEEDVGEVDLTIFM